MDTRLTAGLWNISSKSLPAVVGTQRFWISKRPHEVLKEEDQQPSGSHHKLKIGIGRELIVQVSGEIAGKRVRDRATSLHFLHFGACKEELRVPERFPKPW